MWEDRKENERKIKIYNNNQYSSKLGGCYKEPVTHCL